MQKTCYKNVLAYWGLFEYLKKNLMAYKKNPKIFSLYHIYLDEIVQIKIILIRSW